MGTRIGNILDERRKRHESMETYLMSGKHECSSMVEAEGDRMRAR